MKLFTIGVSKKSAEEFFKLLDRENIDLLLDIRLNNNSQLLGFSKGRDLKYFCEQCHNINYFYEPLFAPTEELITRYRKDKDWQSYEKDFNILLKSRPILVEFQNITKNANNICLLCSETKADKCHRRLIGEYLSKQLNNLEIKHL